MTIYSTELRASPQLRLFFFDWITWLFPPPSPRKFLVPPQRYLKATTPPLWISSVLCLLLISPYSLLGFFRSDLSCRRSAWLPSSAFEDIYSISRRRFGIGHVSLSDFSPFSFFFFCCPGILSSSFVESDQRKKAPIPPPFNQTWGQVPSLFFPSGVKEINPMLYVLPNSSDPLFPPPSNLLHNKAASTPPPHRPR